MNRTTLLGLVLLCTPALARPAPAADSVTFFALVNNRDQPILPTALDRQAFEIAKSRFMARAAHVGNSYYTLNKCLGSVIKKGYGVFQFTEPLHWKVWRQALSDKEIHDKRNMMYSATNTGLTWSGSVSVTPTAVREGGRDLSRASPRWGFYDWSKVTADSSEMTANDWAFDNFKQVKGDWGPTEGFTIGNSGTQCSALPTSDDLVEFAATPGNEGPAPELTTAAVQGAWSGEATQSGVKFNVAVEIRTGTLGDRPNDRLGSLSYIVPNQPTCHFVLSAIRMQNDTFLFQPFIDTEKNATRDCVVGFVKLTRRSETTVTFEEMPASAWATPFKGEPATLGILTGRSNSPMKTKPDAKTRAGAAPIAAPASVASEDSAAGQQSTIQRHPSNTRAMASSDDAGGGARAPQTIPVLNDSAAPSRTVGIVGTWSAVQAKPDGKVTGKATYNFVQVGDSIKGGYQFEGFLGCQAILEPQGGSASTYMFRVQVIKAVMPLLCSDGHLQRVEVKSADAIHIDQLSGSSMQVFATIELTRK